MRLSRTKRICVADISSRFSVPRLILDAIIILCHRFREATDAYFRIRFSPDQISLSTLLEPFISARTVRTGQNLKKRRFQFRTEKEIQQETKNLQKRFQRSSSACRPVIPVLIPRPKADRFASLIMPLRISSVSTIDGPIAGRTLAAG